MIALRLFEKYAVVHESAIPRSRVFGVERARDVGNQLLVTHFLMTWEEVGDVDSANIGVDHDRGGVVGKGSDRGGGIGTDPGE